MDKINAIKQLVKEECDKFLGADNWFYEIHLLAVEKSAKFLLTKLPKANKEIVLLGVWLHDLQRIRKIKGDHQKVGAQEAVKVMKDFGYDIKTIKAVRDVILTHSCSSTYPKTLEGKIISSADAMSHYMNDFFLKIATLGERSLEEYKKWALEKLNRNYNKKIFFPFAKEKIRDKHQLLMKIIK